MAATSIACPIHTLLVVSSTSASCEKDHRMMSSLFQLSKRPSNWARRTTLVPKHSKHEEYHYKFKGLRATLAVFRDNASSLFGSKTASITTRPNSLMNCDANSGKSVAAVEKSTEEEEMKHPTKQRKVVVTGLGVVTPIGHDPDIFYNNLLEGVSGISRIEAFDCSQFSTRIGGEIKSFSADGLMSRKVSRRADKSTLFLLRAGKKALIDGGVTEEVIRELDKKRCGVLIGSALGGMSVATEAIEALRISYKKMHPFSVPFATTSMGSAILAIDLGWMGPNYSISTACATSNYCILNAAYHIIRDDADVMLCGGSDAGIIPIAMGGFMSCKLLSRRNGEPTKASRPWDINRDGCVVGEGAGVLLLEELEHAKKRDARIYAEFLGGSFTCNTNIYSEPHSDGTSIALCLEKALALSGVAREDVNYINAHAASTPSADLKEYQAITRCFGGNPNLRVNSTKSMIGHLLGASGAVEAIATVKAIQTGWVHPNINLENPDESVDKNVLVGAKKERLDIKIALSNSFAFGGQNSTIVFAPHGTTESALQA